MILHAWQHFFLENLIDFAGLYPPAAWSLDQTYQAYRSYQVGRAPSLLGRFICGVQHLSEVAALVAPGDQVRISALLEHPHQVDQVEVFHHKVPRSVRVECVETRWVSPQVADEWKTGWNYPIFFEVSPSQVESAAAYGTQQGPRFALKLRTGGLVPEVLPSVSAVADFLEVAHASKVAYKFTAGLHHARPGLYPLTYASDAPRGRLFGFVDLFRLAFWHWSGRLDGSALRQALGQDRFELPGDPSAEQIQQYRLEAGRCFGSCSFEEPLQELQEMGWIC